MRQAGVSNRCAPVQRTFRTSPDDYPRISSRAKFGGGSPDANAARSLVRGLALARKLTATADPVSQGRAAVVVIHVIRPLLGPRSTWGGLGDESVIHHHRLACGAARFVRPRGLDRPRNEASPRQRLNENWSTSDRSLGKRWSVSSLGIDVGHAKQAQEPALELAQLGREDHGPSSLPNAE
jgi:hypothetical protein